MVREIQTKQFCAQIAVVACCPDARVYATES
jgi:hypothetical protein